MGIHKGREEGPASIFCAVDANGCNASVLVEESGVHVQERKADMSVRCESSDPAVLAVG